MKKLDNVIVRICFLIILISIIGTTYTIYYAYNNNLNIINSGYIIQTQSMIPMDLTFVQILLLIIFVFMFVFSIMYLIYSKFGKIDYKEMFKSNEKTTIMAVESSLVTVLLTLILVICTNIFILTDDRFNISNSQNNYRDNSSYNDGNHA